MSIAMKTVIYVQRAEDSEEDDFLIGRSFDTAEVEEGFEFDCEMVLDASWIQ